MTNNLIPPVAVFVIRSLVIGYSSFCFAAPLEQFSDQTYPMPPNGSLNVRDKDGTVYIYAWLEPGVKVMSRKRAYTSERLKEISVNVSSSEDVTTVDTSFPQQPNGLSLGDRSGTVDYIIFAPQNASVAVELSAGEIIIDSLYGRTIRARLTNGRATVRNCFSDVQINVADGALDVIYDWWEPQRFVFSGDIMRGHVRLFLPVNAAAQVDMESDGKTFNGFAPGYGLEKRGSMKAVIGDGNGAEFRFNAAHGNIGVGKNQ